MQRIQDGVRVGAAGHARALHLVDEEVVHAGKVAAGNLRVVGAGVEGHDHALLPGTAQDVGHAGNLVLQDDQVARAEVGEGGFHVRLGDLAVGARQDDDAVAALFVQLDDGVAGGAEGHLHAGAVDAVGIEGLKQHTAVLAHRTGEVHFIACAAKGNALVEALAAAELLHLVGGNGLSGTDEFLQRIDLINVKRAENDHLHSNSPPRSPLRPAAGGERKSYAHCTTAQARCQQGRWQEKRLSHPAKIFFHPPGTISASRRHTR